ncbi:MAG: TetR/AcrR family transcriptional regulator [Elainellaceae cyanobacterium]
MTTKEMSGRGRPRGFDIEQALAIAQALFHQRGYDGVGVAELSKEIGITAPSLYAAFGSKRQLFERVLQKYVQEEGSRLSAAMAEGETVEAGIAHLFERAAELYTADAARPGCLVLDGTRNCTDAEACSLSARIRQETRQALRDRIAEKFPEQASALADYALTVLMGLSAAARDGLSQAELKAVGRVAAAGFSVSAMGAR